MKFLIVEPSPLPILMHLGPKYYLHYKSYYEQKLTYGSETQKIKKHESRIHASQIKFLKENKVGKLNNDEIMDTLSLEKL